MKFELLKFELLGVFAAHFVAAATHCCDLIQLFISWNSDILLGGFFLSQSDVPDEGTEII